MEEGASARTAAAPTPGVSASDRVLRERRAPKRDAVAGILRHRATRTWWEDGGKPPDGLVGLALSGGGIRSATFSLGLIQALAKTEREAFSRIDILSTVSGGGYIGCFLRTLFMPDETRGISPTIWAESRSPCAIALKDQQEFAFTVLTSGTQYKTIEWKCANDKVVLRRNPLWWLREHSRFLAPNGATDYGYALAYIARNWIGMLYIFMIASLAIFSGVTAVEAASKHLCLVGSQPQLWLEIPRLGGCGFLGSSGFPGRGLSPVLPLVAIPAALSGIVCVAYWLTQAMSTNESDASKQRGNLHSAIVGTLLTGVLIIAATVAAIVYTGSPPPPELKSVLRLMTVLVSSAIILTIAGSLAAMGFAAALSDHGVTLTLEVRRHLTKCLANSNQWFLIIFCVGVLDTAAGFLARHIVAGHVLPAVKWTWILPGLAYVIKKIPEWFGALRTSSVTKFVERSAPAFALLAGALLFGAVALAGNTLVHEIAWVGDPWTSRPNWLPFALFGLIVGGLAVLSGGATGFINLSSLHFFYASRLTRAYLGATNNQRLETAAKTGPHGNIRESHDADYVQPKLYCSVDLPAPLHIINATINETIDPESQIVARDRKGDVLSLEPTGIRLGREPIDWDKVGTKECAEQLSLGQWCAISGAAISTAMGRLTNLGFALSFTFANVRLGYWWWSPGVCTQNGEKPPRFMGFLTRNLGNFVYLANEMTARYRRSYERKYLTDGGHFENTGAYRLIEQRVPLIIVSDNGADPEYRFDDLENLVRKVRLDLGGNIWPLEGSALTEFLGNYGSSGNPIFLDAGGDGDWRAKFRDDPAKPFVIVLRAEFDGETIDIIWLKPRLLNGLPPDVLVYGSANEPFPQQTTGDQFFDESQWESYRALGEISMSRLLASCPGLLA